MCVCMCVLVYLCVVSVYVCVYVCVCIHWPLQELTWWWIQCGVLVHNHLTTSLFGPRAYAKIAGYTCIWPDGRKGLGAFRSSFTKFVKTLSHDFPGS